MKKVELTQAAIEQLNGRPGALEAVQEHDVFLGGETPARAVFFIPDLDCNWGEPGDFDRQVDTDIAAVVLDQQPSGELLYSVVYEVNADNPEGLIKPGGRAKSGDLEGKETHAAPGPSSPPGDNRNDVA